MRKIFLLASVLVLATIANGQKVDLDKFNFKTHIISLPEQFVEKSKRNFGVSVKTSADFGVQAEQRIFDSIKMTNFTKTETDPTVRVNVTLDQFKLSTSDIKERVVESKSKEGVVSKSYYYKVEAIWNKSGNYGIYGPYKKSQKEIEREEAERVELAEKAKAKNETLKGNAFLKTTDLAANAKPEEVNLKEKPMYRRFLGGYSTSKDYEGKEFGSSRDASTDFNRNFVNIQNEVIESTIAAVINNVNWALKINYDFAFDTVQDHLWLLDSKKHPEFEMQTQALTAARLLFDNIKANEPIGNTANDFQPLIDYFASLPGKYTSDDKSDKKIRYGAFFNLSKIYYFLDQPDKSIEAAEKLIKNDYDTKDGERLIKEANQLKKDMDFQKVDGQHFVIDWK